MTKNYKLVLIIKCVVLPTSATVVLQKGRGLISYIFWVSLSYLEGKENPRSSS
jgi:hypothetical protein